MKQNKAWNFILSGLNIDRLERIQNKSKIIIYLKKNYIMQVKSLNN